MDSPEHRYEQTKEIKAEDTVITAAKEKLTVEASSLKRPRAQLRN